MSGFLNNLKSNIKADLNKQIQDGQNDLNNQVQDLQSDLNKQVQDSQNDLNNQAQNVQTNLNNQAQDLQKGLDTEKQGLIKNAQDRMRKANDDLGKKFDETKEKLDNAVSKVTDGIKNFLPPTEEDKFRNDLLLLSTMPDFQEYFAQSVSKRLASEFYMKISNVGKSSNEISVLLKKSDFKEIQEDNEDISDFFIDLKPDDVPTISLCTVIDDKYNLLKEDKIRKFLKDAMVLYVEVIQNDFQKLAEIITECKKIEKKRLKKKNAKFLIDEITELFEKPSLSGGLLIKKQQIDKNNKADLIDGNIIKYIKDNVFYTVKKDATGKIILNNCGSGVDLNDETKINEILDSKKCIFVADQEDPTNSCKQMQAQTSEKDLDDYFYNETLLKILIKNKTVFSKCLRTKLSPVFNKVLEKLYEFKGEEIKTINLTYSDKSYPIRTNIEKIIEKMVCQIGIIKITDLEPFMNIVEPLNKNNINLLKNLLKKVKDKKQKEKDPTKIAKMDANLEEINAKLEELESSEPTKKKEVEKKGERYQLAKEEEEELSNAPYKILGLNKNATINDIKNTYKKMSLIYHPDRVPVANNTHKQYTVENANKINNFFGGIKTANDILIEIIENPNNEESIREEHILDYENLLTQIKNKDDIAKLTAIKGGKKITRKSSSRVSRKTRRHKQTSR